MQPTRLLSPIQYGPFQFKNRVFMAPMTRSRAPEHIPTDLMSEYYAQRASAGLIFTEATQIMADLSKIVPDFYLKLPTGLSASGAVVGYRCESPPVIQ